MAKYFDTCKKHGRWACMCPAESRLPDDSLMLEMHEMLHKAAKQEAEEVRHKPKTTWYHQDHSLTQEHIQSAETALQERGLGFHIVSVAIKTPLPNALYGPASGDLPITEGTIQKVREGRQFSDRMIELPTRPSNTMTVIGKNNPDGTTEIYTAHGGPAAERNPEEPGLSPEELAASNLFWSEHALATREVKG